MHSVSEVGGFDFRLLIGQTSTAQVTRFGILASILKNGINERRKSFTRK